jgi:hypothetical protein
MKTALPSDYLHLADNRPNHYPPQGNRYGGTIAVRHYTEQVREWYLGNGWLISWPFPFICENRSPIASCFLPLLVVPLVAPLVLAVYKVAALHC